METLVSVITPMYQNEKHLRQSIGSFTKQTMFQRCELILVDDCSPDHCAEIAKEYEREFPNNIRVLGYEKNRRAGGARNYGLKAARGKYVLFMDADDLLAEDALEKLYGVAESGAFEIVDCDYFTFDDCQDSVLEYQVSMNDCSIGIQDTEKRSQNIVRGGRLWTKLILKDYLIDNNLYYPENILFEDNGIGAVICYPAKSIGKVREALYYYRMHNPTSQTANVSSRNSILDRLEASRNLLGEAKRIGAYEECYDAVAYRFTELFYASNLNIYLRGSFKLQVELLYAMRCEIKSSFPDYKTTRYYKILSREYRVCCSVNDISPWLLVALKKVWPIMRFAYKKAKKLLCKDGEKSPN